MYLAHSKLHFCSSCVWKVTKGRVENIETSVLRRHVRTTKCFLRLNAKKEDSKTMWIERKYVHYKEEKERMIEQR